MTISTCNIGSGRSTTPTFSVQIQELKGRGRGAVTTGPIPKGTQVAVCKPLAVVVSHDWLKYCCTHCLIRGDKRVLKCTQCGYAYYCNDECQRKDSSIHAICCPVWQQLRGRWPKIQRMGKSRKAAMLDKSIVLGKEDLDHLRLIVQILALRQLDRATDQYQLPLEIPLASLGDPTWNDFIAMQSSAHVYVTVQAQVRKQQPSDHDWELYHQQQRWDYMYFILETITDRVLLPNREIFNDIIYREKANAFGYWDDESEELVGYGVFPRAAFFNHACDANLSKRVTPDGVEFTTLRDISAGEELCIFYGNNPEEPGPERRERLWWNYFFHCHCNRCRAECHSEPSV